MNSYLDRFMLAVQNTSFIAKDNSITDYSEFINRLVSVFSSHKKQLENRTYFIGNGGSAAIAIHMTADYLKNGGITTVGMYDPATITCLGNDYGYKYVFSKQLERLVQPGDLLVAISSSGNSQNIINAIEVAHAKGAEVITFTGFKPDNKAKQMGDYNLYVPSMEYGIVESIHNMILQQIVDEVMATNE